MRFCQGCLVLTGEPDFSFALFIGIPQAVAVAIEKNQIVALSSVIKPSDFILNKLKEYKVTSIVKMASSYKFCVIASGEYDIYAARERANEWDYAAGHAIAQNAGAIIKTLDDKPFLYGKEDYRNPSLLLKRSNYLND